MTLGAASAAEEISVDDSADIGDGESLKMASSIDEIDVNGDISNTSSDVISDNAINEKVGASNNDVLGDDLEIVTPENVYDWGGPTFPTHYLFPPSFPLETISSLVNSKTHSHTFSLMEDVWLTVVKQNSLIWVL